MPGLTYEDVVAQYRPLFDKVGTVEDAQVERAEQIAQRVTVGFPDQGIGPMEAVIDRAARMIENAMSVEGAKMTQAQFNRVGNIELEVLLHTASVTLAMKEAREGKVTDDAALGEAMITEMEWLLPTKNELKALSSAHVRH